MFAAAAAVSAFRKLERNQTSLRNPQTILDP
jgi:hypothetical protein